ncbi:MAG: sensor histidine kinase, partial [Polyangiales bacterium]
TGLALYFQAELRDAAGWGWFAFGAIGLSVTLLSLLDSALRAGQDVEQGMPAQSSPAESAQSVASESGSAEADAGDSPKEEEDDDVDYLMALRHEFRTPLNAVLGFSDVLLSGIDGDVNESQREDLEIIRASGIRLRVLLDSALDLSQIADGRLRLNAERADVREQLSRVAVEAGQLWSSKRSAKCSLPDEPCFTEADAERLRRSILVLADFLATDHRESEIALELSRTETHLSIEITADQSERLSIDALPTTVEVLASEDATEIRRWPVAVTAEVISRHEGSLYHGEAPSRFLIRLPVRGAG